MTKARILAEARSVFAHKGYAEASLREIAEAVGIKTPSLYAHFAGKEALYAEVYAEVAADHTAFFDELIRASVDLAPLPRLRHLLDGIGAYYRERPERHAFSMRAAVDENGPEGERLRAIFLDSESDLAEAVRQTYHDGVASDAFPPGDPDGFTALVFVIMDGLFLQLAHYDPELYAERFERTWAHLAALLSA